MALRWESIQWPDGSTYEGLTNSGKCHERGVLKYKNGDRYEGEFLSNHMAGYGVYVWKDGTVYRGQWQDSAMQGCGVRLGKSGDFLTAEEGKFLGDEWVGEVMGCSREQAREAAREADLAASMARAFQVPQHRHRRGKVEDLSPAAEGPRDEAAESQEAKPSVGGFLGRGH
mmetsp:Transcript_11659/g.33029  ORF Transcript_11659/g.33029 Transcript_11659/m.33029 type:complete len:171 (+) Transcript_11659:212-724(+)